MGYLLGNCRGFLAHGSFSLPKMPVFMHEVIMWGKMWEKEGEFRSTVHEAATTTAEKIENNDSSPPDIVLGSMRASQH